MSAWCRKTLVGMQPTCRQVPPRNGVFLDDDGLQSPLRGANRGDVAARSAPDDREIVFSQTGSPLRLVFQPEPIDAWKGGYDCGSSKVRRLKILAAVSGRRNPRLSTMHKGGALSNRKRARLTR